MSSDAATLFFSPDDWSAIVGRIALAALAGGAVGLNRDRRRRPAGLRTYMTVSVGSALFVMLILQAGIDLNATNALSRTVQGVTTGVGFIGAGLIFQRGRQLTDQSQDTQVKGLTSAAALWLTASLGTAAGCGLWRTTVVGTFTTLLILSGFQRIKKVPAYRLHIRRQPRLRGGSGGAAAGRSISATAEQAPLDRVGDGGGG